MSRYDESGVSRPFVEHVELGSPNAGDVSDFFLVATLNIVVT